MLYYFAAIFHIMLKHIRHLENIHIILWLIKDSCWLLHFKVGGVIMVIPTVFMAIYIAYKTRKTMNLFLPNLAVCCWIAANAIWMLGEFFDFYHVPFALTFFFLGLVVIAYYFSSYKQLENDV
jgi:hypothetical protein